MAPERASDVRGPDAMMAGPGGSSVTSSRMTRIPGWEETISVIPLENRIRSTASAEPAATRDIFGDPQKEGTQGRHLSFQLAVGVSRVFALEGIGADELAEIPGLMGRGRPTGPHLQEIDPVALLGQEDRSLTAGQPSSDDFDGLSHDAPSEQAGEGRSLRFSSPGGSSLHPTPPATLFPGGLFPFPFRAFAFANRSTASSMTSSLGSTPFGRLAFSVPSVT